MLLLTICSFPEAPFNLAGKNFKYTFLSFWTKLHRFDYWNLRIKSFQGYVLFLSVFHFLGRLSFAKTTFFRVSRHTTCVNFSNPFMLFFDESKSLERMAEARAKYLYLDAIANLWKAHETVFAPFLRIPITGAVTCAYILFECIDFFADSGYDWYTFHT